MANSPRIRAKLSLMISDPVLRRDIKVMGLVGSAHAISHFFQLSLPPLFILIRAEFDLSFTALGAVITALYVISALCQALVGAWVDRYGARRILLGGIGLIAVSAWAMAAAPNYPMLLVAALFAGLGNGVFHPADLAILSLKISPGRIGRAYSIHATFGTIGYAVAPAVMGTAAILAGWRGALVVAGLIGCAVWLALFFYGRELETVGAKRERGAAVTLAQIVANPTVIAAFFFFALTAGAGVGLQTYLATAYVRLFDVALTLASFGLTAYLIGSACGTLIGGVVADRTVHHDRVAIGGLVIGIVLYSLVAIVAMPFVLTATLVVIGGLCVGATAPSRDMLVRAITPRGASGRVFGVVYSGIDLGAAVAPIFLGMLMDRDMPLGIFVIAAGALAAAIGVVMILRAAAIARRVSVPAAE